MVKDLSKLHKVRKQRDRLREALDDLLATNPRSLAYRPQQEAWDRAQALRYAIEMENSE